MDTVTEIFTVWGQMCRNSKTNAFSRTQNTPRTSRGGREMIFSQEEQTIVFWRFFNETKEKLEKISLLFSSCNHFHPSDPQPDTLNFSLGELVK